MVGDELLLEALLRRGFLAYRDDQGVWLGTGSHPADLDVLRLVRGLSVRRLPGHKDRMARVNIRTTGVSAVDVALAIVSLFEGEHLMTSAGIPGFMGSDGWGSYRKMAWGAKLPIGPGMKTVKDYLSVQTGILDLGVALLVKAFPLARVATVYSCDGHGETPAQISFQFDWDPHWGKAVYDVLGYAAHDSTWDWEAGLLGGGNHLHIAPHGGFGNVEVLGMLNDIQQFARRLLDQSTIDKIGRARIRTLEALGDQPPIHKHFAEEARRQLASEFA